MEIFFRKHKSLRDKCIEAYGEEFGKIYDNLCKCMEDTMIKYIDAEKIIAEIDYRLHCNGAFDEVGDYQWHYDQGMVDAYKYIREVVTSLQQEQPDCHTVEDWIQHIKNADQITKDIFSKGPYDVLYDALNHPYQHCYDAIKEFGELCFQTGVNSVKQGQPEVDLEKEMDKFFEGMPIQEHENIFEDTYHMIARHFYELGLNARKEK